LITILVMSGYGAAHGGWAFGPRYLILVIPFLLDSFFDGEIHKMSSLWQGFLFGLSMILCTLPALTFPLALPEFTFPHRDFWLPFLIDEGWFVPNLANVAGVPSTVWALIPVFVALAVVIFIVTRSMRRPQRFFTGFAAAIVVVSL